jgi:hypothetical protein
MREGALQSAAYGVLPTGDGLPPVSPRRLSSREPTSASAMTGMPSTNTQRNQDRTSRPTTLAQNSIGVERASITGAPDEDEYYGHGDMEEDERNEEKRFGGGSSSSIEAFEARQANRAPPPPVRRQMSGESGHGRGGSNATAAAAAAAAEAAARAYDDAWGSEVTVGDGFGDDDGDNNDRAFTWGETRVGPDADYSVAGGAAAGMTHMSLQNTESLRAKQAHEEFVLQMQQQTLLQSQQMAAMMGMAPAPPSSINGNNGNSFYTSLPPPRALPIAETSTMPAPQATVSLSPRLISTDAADAKFQEFERKLREKDKDIGE